MIDISSSSEQSLRRSANSAVLGGAVGLVTVSFVGLLISGGPVTWIFVGPLGGMIGFLTYGGYTLASHLALRWLCVRQDLVPPDFASFLDYTVDCTFLRKTGNGYIFLHQILQEHFAHTNPAQGQDQRRRDRRLHTAIWILRVLGLLLVIGGLVVSISQSGKGPPKTRATETGSSTFAVERQLVRDDLCVVPGDVITLTATGRVSIGAYVGEVEPTGTERGFVGIPLGDQYDVEPALRSGALLWRVSGEKAWRAYTPSAPTEVGAAGCLEFTINDRETWLHKGEFHVTVDMRKGEGASVQD